MIKKTINYCWFGHGKKSELILKCIESWKKYCPDYDIVEWNEDNYDIHKNKYMEEAYNNKKWAFVSDYARLDIIYNNGGIYLDTDVEIIKSMDKIIEGKKAFFCVENEYINTGLGFGAEKGCLILKELLESYDKISFVKSDGTLDVLSCPVRNDTVFKNYIDKSKINEIQIANNIYFYPKEYFCPLDYETKILNKTSETVGIHWYGESWLTPQKRLKKKLKRIYVRIFGINSFNKIKSYIKRGR